MGYYTFPRKRIKSRRVRVPVVIFIYFCIYICVCVCEDRERSRTQFVSFDRDGRDEKGRERNEEIVLGVVFGKTNSGAPFQYVCISAGTVY